MRPSLSGTRLSGLSREEALIVRFTCNEGQLGGVVWIFLVVNVLGPSFD